MQLEPLTIIQESITTYGNKVIAGESFKTIKISDNEQLVFVLPKKLMILKYVPYTQYMPVKCYIFRTADGKNLATTKIFGVLPKVELLFWVDGKSQFNKTLTLLEQLKAKGIEFNNLSNAYWLHQNARIQTGRPLILPRLKNKKFNFV